MARHDLFNRDLGDYLNRRIKPRKSFSGLKIRLPKIFEDENEPSAPQIRSNKVHVVYGKPGFLDRLFGRRQDYDDIQEEEAELEDMKEEIRETDRQIEAAHEIEEELEEKREGLTKRFFRSLFGGREQPDDVEVGMPEEVEPEAEPITPEVKEVLRISGKWLNRLDKKAKAEFRESNDFEKYKFYLDKWGLTKKKE
ncbi:hypothetical protein JW711_03635 [Candidatus Woesearchaeota archaeon]|nr:hypothetical protein [Candidatus Woesearchaeota archaeon]